MVECLPQGSGFNPLHHIKQVWWYMLIILVLEKWRQEEEMFGEEVSLDYVVNFSASLGDSKIVSTWNMCKFFLVL